MVRVEPIVVTLVVGIGQMSRACYVCALDNENTLVGIRYEQIKPQVRFDHCCYDFAPCTPFECLFS